MSSYNRTSTMKDVAKSAGVTQATVSYVINGTANISANVTERVHEAIKELGYQPNIVAQNLKNKFTKIIGLLLPDIHNPYYATIAFGVEKKLRENGYVTFLACTNNLPNVESLYINTFIGHNVAGIIATYSLVDNSLYDTIENNSIPLVLLDHQLTKKEIPNVQVHNEEGGILATQFLIDLGYRKIAIASEPIIAFPLQQRINGYKRALKMNQIQFLNKYIFTTNHLQDTFDIGYQIADLIVGSDIEAIFATSDRLALGILRNFYERKIRVPTDISLIGYDNVVTSKISIPALTTISQPMEQMAEVGVSLLLNIISGHSQQVEILLMPSLIIRETTCKKI